MLKILLGYCILSYATNAIQEQCNELLQMPKHFSNIVIILTSTMPHYSPCMTSKICIRKTTVCGPLVLTVAFVHPWPQHEFLIRWHGSYSLCTKCWWCSPKYHLWRWLLRSSKWKPGNSARLPHKQRKTWFATLPPQKLFKALIIALPIGFYQGWAKIPWIYFMIQDTSGLCPIQYSPFLYFHTFVDSSFHGNVGWFTVAGLPIL